MDILDFWFPDDKYQKFWFNKSLDLYIKNNYTEILHYYESTEINLNNIDDNYILRIIIILDQFSRNIYRNQNFKKNDEKTLEIAKYFFDNRSWKDKPLHHLIFYLMPFRHSNKKDNYDFIFNILNQIDKSKLNNNHVVLYNKFYKVTEIKNSLINI
jgi:uncharacterized protein (DUF924 family)